MKKLIGAIASLAATVVMASPVNNPASTAQFDAGLFTGAQQDYTVRVGVVSNSVCDRKLEVKSSKSHVDTASFRESGLALTVGMFNRFDVYARVGAAKLDLLLRNAGGYNTSISTAMGTNWAFGGRAVLYSIDNTTLNVFGEYSRFRADVKDVVVGADSSGYTASRARAEDWHLGVGVSHTIAVSPDFSVVPNLAVRYSDAKLRFTNETSPGIATLERMQARGNFGGSIGCGFYAGKMFGVNVNANFFDEAAVGVTAEIRI